MKSGFVFENGRLVPKKEEKIIEQAKVDDVQQKSYALVDVNEVKRPNVQLSEGVVQFRERSDLTVFQILDEKTGRVMAYISGYALDINFNLGELKSVESIEQLIDGIGNMFRKIVLDKIVAKNKN